MIGEDIIGGYKRRINGRGQKRLGQDGKEQENGRFYR